MVWSTSEHKTNLRRCVYFFRVESHESRFSGGSSNTGLSGDTEILHLKVTDKGISGFCTTSLSKQASFGELQIAKSIKNYQSKVNWHISLE